MIEIPLTKGYIAIVDDEDADLAKFKWNALISRGGSVYAVRSFRENGIGKWVKLHRIILERKLGHAITSELTADHINRNSLDNRRKNLRGTTVQQNNQNRGKLPSNKSGYIGVSRYGNKWKAQIQVKGKTYNLGHFEDILEAAIAYNEAAYKLRGEFAVLNEIPNIGGIKKTA